MMTPPKDSDQLTRWMRDRLDRRGHYGARSIAEMYATFGELRRAVASEGTPAVQSAFDQVEEWIDFAFANASETPARKAAG